LTPVPVRGCFLAGLLVFVGWAVRIATAIRYRRCPAGAGQDSGEALGRRPLPRLINFGDRVLSL